VRPANSFPQAENGNHLIHTDTAGPRYESVRATPIPVRSFV
jgi:hypothetical protein